MVGDCKCDSKLKMSNTDIVVRSREGRRGRRCWRHQNLSLGGCTHRSSMPLKLFPMMTILDSASADQFLHRRLL